MRYPTGIPNWGYFSGPTTFNADTLVHAGDIGRIFFDGTKRWQIVKIVDAANGAAGDVVYWKNYASYQVTPTIGNSSRNEVAGVMEVAATAANYYVAIRQGGLMNVKSEAAQTFARGDNAIAFSANNSVAKVAAGTASTYKPLGVAQAVESGGFVSVFLDLSPV
jgi:hypothetical protein